jgi:hypothetical protein
VGLRELIEGVVMVEGAAPGDHRIKHGRRRIEIRAGVYGPAERLLRREEPGRPEHNTLVGGERERRRAGARTTRVDDLREPEIKELYRTRAGAHDAA